MHLNHVVVNAGCNALDKGFHTMYSQLKDTLNTIKTNDNESDINALLEFIDNQNICTNLMLVVSELGEAVEHLRAGRFANSETWKETFEEEIADAIIRLGDLCFHLGIDIKPIIEKKMKYNTERPIKHGKKF